ncbi:MAG TPA: nucleotide exchange factor GrpE [Phycisphaerales bacterium]|nr:nucleotide exchange factor GrpE [Phycisphaerales bacterium]
MVSEMKKVESHKSKPETAPETTPGSPPDAHVKAGSQKTPASGPGGAAEALEKKIAELEQANAELREQHLRLQADYANHEKRTLKRIADDVDRQKRTLLLALLPSLDNFPAALAHAEAAKDGGPDAVTGLVEGVRRVFQHLLDALAAQGVVRIDAVGQPFDPTVHEAMMQRCEPDQPDGVVLEEVQPGYRLEGRLLRPAKVIVNKHVTNQEPAEAHEGASAEPGESGDGD